MNTPKLKTKVKRIFEVDYSDFDEFVRAIYGGNFEFVADHEANNYSSYEFSCPNVHTDFGGKEEASIREGKYNDVSVHAIFNTLHKDGHIPAGDYIISVFW